MLNQNSKKTSQNFIIPFKRYIDKLNLPIMKKLVFESLNEFMQGPQEDTYLNHIVEGLGDYDEDEDGYAEDRELKALLQENSDILALVDEMKNSVVDWSWDDIDEHNAAPDTWAFEPILDREGVKETMVMVLNGFAEFFGDMDKDVDPTPFLEQLRNL